MPARSALDPKTRVTWRKSSHSPSNGGNCVEVGSWRKSSRTNASGANCVEAGTCICHGIAIRDSKLPTTGDFPTLTITSADWTSLLAEIRTSSLDS